MAARRDDKSLESLILHCNGNEISAATCLIALHRRRSFQEHALEESKISWTYCHLCSSSVRVSTEQDPSGKNMELLREHCVKEHPREILWSILPKIDWSLGECSRFSIELNKFLQNGLQFCISRHDVDFVKGQKNWNQRRRWTILNHRRFECAKEFIRSQLHGCLPDQMHPAQHACRILERVRGTFLQVISVPEFPRNANRVGFHRFTNIYQLCFLDKNRFWRICGTSYESRVRMCSFSDLFSV